VSFAAEVGIPLRGASAARRLSRKGPRSLDGSLIVRGLERVGAAITEPASEERESSWKVVGLMFRRDILFEVNSRGELRVKLFAEEQILTPAERIRATQSNPNPSHILSHKQQMTSDVEMHERCEKLNGHSLYRFLLTFGG